MRQRLSIYFCTLTLLLSLFTGKVYSQEPGGLDGFSIKANGGFLSFWGEVADAGIAPLFDSRFGFSLSGIKMFNSWFGIQAQFLQGNTFGIRNDTKQYFKGSVTDFSLSARLEPLNLISSIDLGRITPYTTMGLATISYRSARRVLGTNLVYQPVFGYKTDGVTPAPKENGLAIPISIGIDFQLTPKLAIEVEHAQRITNQDVIDAMPGTSSFNDMYALTSIGIKYTLKPSVRKSIPPDVQAKPKKTRKESNTQPSKSRKTKTNERVKSQDDPYNYSIPVVTAFVERILPETVQSGKMFEVKLRINKGSYKGSATLTQRFPVGFTAVEAQPGKGRFEFINQTAIINWDQMPSDSIVTYKYQVRTGENLAGSITIPGKFEYDQPDGLKSHRFTDYIYVENKMESQMDRKYNELIGADEGNKTQNSIRDLSIENKTDDELNTSIEELMRQYGIDQPVKKSTSTQQSTNIVSYKPVSGLEFRVQCGAFRNKSEGGARLARKYGITEKLTEEYLNGWYKYTVGSFKSYADAVRFRDAFIQRTKIWGAYIVGYQNGTRLKSISQYIR